MNRPSQHGGGQSGPPTAGDPSTSPDDARPAVIDLLAEARAVRMTARTLARHPVSTCVAGPAPRG